MMLYGIMTKPYYECQGFFLLLKMELDPYLVILSFKFEKKIHFLSIFFNCKPLCFQHHISRELYVINKSYAYFKHDWAHYLANQLVYNYSIIINKSFDSEAKWLINEYQNNDKIIFYDCRLRMVRNIRKLWFKVDIRENNFFKANTLSDQILNWFIVMIGLDKSVCLSLSSIVIQSV